jgi:hypothetical protein
MACIYADRLNRLLHTDVWVLALRVHNFVACDVCYKTEQSRTQP